MSTEIGYNIVPQYTDFYVRFSNVTKDGSGFNFNTVGAWIFGMSSSLSGVPTVLKASTGTTTSGDFTLDNTNKNVTVSVRASEFSRGYGEYRINLWAETSGRRITHLPKTLSVVPSLNPSGV